MKLLKADVNWMEKYANDPRLELTVDALVPHDIFRYQSKEVNGSTLYFASHNDSVSFYCHNPLNEHGYGGGLFRLTQIDGREVTIKGPWSSRAGVMNNHFLPHSVSATLIVQGVKYSGHVTLGFALAAVARLPGVYLLRRTKHGETTYVPSKAAVLVPANSP